jgi:hypothetical protein
MACLFIDQPQSEYKFISPFCLFRLIWTVSGGDEGIQACIGMHLSMFVEFYPRLV